MAGRIFAGVMLLFLVETCPAGEQEFKALRIAHAGGGILGKTYTNSYNALDWNIKKGFLYFEIDFSFTKDNQLVCIHDWEQSFKRSFGFNTKEKPDLETFEFLARNASRFNKCTLGGLAVWMSNNPSATLITDVKENNIEALKVIIETMPDARTRVIPQIYLPMNFSIVKQMGFESIIWTLYKYRGTKFQVINWADRFTGPFAITMPTDRATTDLPARLKEKHIPTYVHTINDREKLDMFINEYGLTEIYTDTLQPENTP
jgi:glycerophosphoryl diester phosphodiesterase